MNKYLRIVLLVSGICGLLLFHACVEETPPLPDNVVEFETDQLGIAENENELVVNFTLTRSADVEGTISVSMESINLTYGTDFTTDPAYTPDPHINEFEITVPAGSTTSSFKIIKAEGALFDGDEHINFQIAGTLSLVIGEKKELTVTFAEIVSSTGELEVAGGGATYPNKVFIDLSSNRQTAVDRTTWDLGFLTTDGFRVILNSSNGMMARALDKTDMTAVTAADTVGFGAQQSMAAVFAAINSPTPPEWLPEAVNWIDAPSGDLDMTAIASVSATVTENKVYIINRGTGPGANQPALGWKKIRILRNGSNYTLQHADINSSTFTEVQVVKDANYRFNYVSFATGAVSVEPEKTKWDIAWTGFSNVTDFGTGPVPYYFQDVVLLNRSGVEVVQVLEAETTYDAFAETNIAGLIFSNSQIAIGSTWRTSGGPNGPPSLKTDRYYIVKDPDGNYYKLKFTALTTNGERGKPQFKYALVKKAS